MAQPFLGLGNIRPVLQGIGGGGSPQGMDTEARHIIGYAGVFRVVPDNVIDCRGVEWFIQLTRLPARFGVVVLNRPEGGRLSSMHVRSFRVGQAARGQQPHAGYFWPDELESAL